jgi:hypothetical protein
MFYMTVFPLPEKPLNDIRINPGDKEGEIPVRSIRIPTGCFLTVHRHCFGCFGACLYSFWTGVFVS